MDYTGEHTIYLKVLLKYIIDNTGKIKLGN